MNQSEKVNAFMYQLEHPLQTESQPQAVVLEGDYKNRRMTRPGYNWWSNNKTETARN